MSPLPVVILIATSVAACGLTGCSTATYARLESTPAGASVIVQGRDTGRVTPTKINLEVFAADPDEPMPVELRLDGYVPTHTYPYPRRHECGQFVCEHKRRGTLRRHLPLFKEGGGLRLDARRDDYEIRIDRGPWIPVDGTPQQPGTVAGITVPLEPGVHELAWRRPVATGRAPSRTIAITIPEHGYLALDLHRWPWGVPSR